MYGLFDLYTNDGSKTDIFHYHCKNLHLFYLVAEVFQLHLSASLFYRYKCICGSTFSVEAELKLGFLRTVKSKIFK